MVIHGEILYMCILIEISVNVSHMNLEKITLSNSHRLYRIQ